MKDEVKELLEDLKNKDCYINNETTLKFDEAGLLLNCITNLQTIEQQYSAVLSENAELENKITNLQEENKIKDTNWESLKYYLEKLYYKDYIEEVISDDIDKKIKELESKVEIKGYQKDIKTLQEENERLKEDMKIKDNTISINYNKDTKEYTLDRKNYYKINKRLNERLDYKSRNEKAIEYIRNNIADIEFIKKQYNVEIYDDYVETTINDIEKLLNILQGEDKE